MIVKELMEELEKRDPEDKIFLETSAEKPGNIIFLKTSKNNNFGYGSVIESFQVYDNGLYCIIYN